MIQSYDWSPAPGLHRERLQRGDDFGEFDTREFHLGNRWKLRPLSLQEP